MSLQDLFVLLWKNLTSRHESCFKYYHHQPQCITMHKYSGLLVKGFDIRIQNQYILIPSHCVLFSIQILNQVDFFKLAQTSVSEYRMDTLTKVSIVVPLLWIIIDHFQWPSWTHWCVDYNDCWLEESLSRHLNCPWWLNRTIDWRSCKYLVDNNR